MVVSSGGAEVARQSVTLATADRKTLVIDARPRAPEPPAPEETREPPVVVVDTSHRGLRTAAYVAGSVGVVGLATFAVFGALEKSTYNDLQSACQGGPCPPEKASDISTGRSRQTIANVGLAAGSPEGGGGGCSSSWGLLRRVRRALGTLVVSPGFVGVGGSLWPRRGRCFAAVFTSPSRAHRRLSISEGARAMSTHPRAICARPTLHRARPRRRRPWTRRRSRLDDGNNLADDATADRSLVDAMTDQSTSDVIDSGKDAAPDQAGRDAEAGVCGATSQTCCTGGICGAQRLQRRDLPCGGAPGQALRHHVRGRRVLQRRTVSASGDDGPNGGTVCSDGSIVGCGGTGQPCCARNGCTQGRCCVGGRCVGSGNSCGSTLGTCSLNRCTGGTPASCGSSGLACCPGEPNGVGNASDFCTQSGTACDPGTGVGCRTCGGTGQPCCDGQVCLSGGCCDANSHQCIAIGASCPAGQGICVLGGCQGGACGRLGAPCCGSGVSCTAPSSTCSNGTCVACGGSGQPCCPPNRGSGAYCGEPFVCQSGTNRCVACGATTNACCAGSVCTMTACSATNVCQ